MYFAGLPYHLIQRGNNREAYLVERENYQFYLGLRKEISIVITVAVQDCVSTRAYSCAFVLV